MSGDGPLNVLGGMLRWYSHPLVTAHPDIVDQLDRARRCAEAEAERDAALAKLERVEKDRGGWIDFAGATVGERHQLHAENARLRAELAARPDLTELREYARANNPILGGYDLAAIIDRLLVADPAPAPDTDPPCWCGNPQAGWGVCAFHLDDPATWVPAIADHREHPAPAPDTVAITVSREVAEGLAYLADYFNPEAAAPFRSALDAGQ